MNNLKLKLKKVDAIKYGVITGATMALLSFIILVLVFLFTSLVGLGAGASALGLGAFMGGGIFAIILGPILYFIIGFIFAWIGALILNFILKKTDGLNLEFEKNDLDIHKIGNE